MPSVQLLVKKNGDIQCLYTDSLPLRELGKMTVARASNVEFDTTNGTWSVKLVETGEIIGSGFIKRKDAIDFEIDYLNGTLK